MSALLLTDDTVAEVLRCDVARAELIRMSGKIRVGRGEIGETQRAAADFLLAWCDEQLVRNETPPANARYGARAASAAVPEEPTSTGQTPATTIARIKPLLEKLRNGHVSVADATALLDLLPDLHFTRR